MPIIFLKHFNACAHVLSEMEVMSAFAQSKGRIGVTKAVDSSGAAHENLNQHLR